MAQSIIWPNRFEAQRRIIMSSAMISMRGRLQKEGEVIHVICDSITDRTAMLGQVGRLSFPHRTGRGDGATHGGAPDRGDIDWKRCVRDHYHPAFRTDAEIDYEIR